MDALKLRLARALDWARTHKALVVAVVTAVVSVVQHVYPEFPAADVLSKLTSVL